VDHVLDARGLRCPLPLLRARAALAGLPPHDTLVVLADDPEAAIDLGALAVDAGRTFSVAGEGRLVLAPAQQ
jgi:tRNA 2-thiouridine synthesizing protein A